MQWTDVESSNLKRVGYDAGARRMLVVFNNGSRCAYPNVSQEEHDALVNAPSVGKHFYQNIRGREFEKLAREEEAA